VCVRFLARVSPPRTSRWLRAPPRRANRCAEARVVALRSLAHSPLPVRSSQCAFSAGGVHVVETRLVAPLLSGRTLDARFSPNCCRDAPRRNPFAPPGFLGGGSPLCCVCVCVCECDSMHYLARLIWRRIPRERERKVALLTLGLSAARCG
jgi:hypothetical protein